MANGGVAIAAYTAARDSGYADYTLPFFGHGLGTDARIPPAVHAGNPDRLEQGTVFELFVQTTVPALKDPDKVLSGWFVRDSSIPRLR